VFGQFIDRNHLVPNVIGPGLNERTAAEQGVIDGYFMPDPQQSFCEPASNFDSPVHGPSIWHSF
jgi:hypothetical protein